MNEVIVSKELAGYIMSHLTYDQIEKGGILTLQKTPDDKLEITNIWLDEVQGTARLYRPGEGASEQILTIWKQGNIPAFIHSHPYEMKSNHEECQLSSADIYYAREFLKLNGCDYIYMFVVIPGSIAGYKITLEQCIPCTEMEVELRNEKGQKD